MKQVYLLFFCSALFFSNLAAQDPAGWRYTYTPYYRPINAVHVVDHNTIVVAGGNETNDKIRSIFRTEDGGQNWQIILDLLDSSWIKSMYFINPYVGFATGFEGLLLKTMDGGVTWTKINLTGNAATRNFNSIFFIDAQTGFMAGGNRTNDSIQTILKTTDGGSSWNIKRDLPGSWLKTVYFTDANTGYAVGEAGVALKTIDGGDTWNQMTLPGSAASRVYNTVVFKDANTGFLGGGNEFNDSIQTLLKTTDAGASWNIIIDSIAPWISSVEFLDANTGFAVGDDGTVLVSNDGGDTWNDAGIPDTVGGSFSHHRVVHFENRDFGLVAGTFGKIMFYNAPVSVTALVQTDLATNPGVSSVTLNGKVNSNGNASAVTFEYWTLDGDARSISAEPDSVFGNTPTPVKATVSGLDPNTLYYFRVKAENANGTSYGNVRQIFVGANPIPNWDFESWDTLQFFVPDVWVSLGNISQVPSYDGSHALGLSGDSRREAAAVFFGIPNDNGIAGGAPLAARPDSIVGYFNYDIAPNDSALLLVFLKKNGVFNCQQFNYITGSSGGNFQRLSFPLTYTDFEIPDTVIVGIASSDPIFSPYIDSTSYLAVDNISFSGTTENIPNNDFEDWYIDTIEVLQSWVDPFESAVAGLPQNVLKSPDRQHGTYAAKLINNRTGAGDRASISLDYNDGSRFPVYHKHSNLNLFLKYVPDGDTASVQIDMYEAGQRIAYNRLLLDSAISSYTLFSLPLNYVPNTFPDSASITVDIGSSATFGNSVLYVDNLSFDGFYVSAEENISVDKSELSWNMYPNPAREIVFIKGVNSKKENVVLSVLTINGTLVLKKTLSLTAGNFETSIDTQSLPTGIYLVTLQRKGALQFRKLVVTR